jgi:hypothetical protein
MFARFAATAALCSTLLLTSCLDYEEELTIHKDLSGEALVTINLPDTLVSKYDAVHSEFTQAKMQQRFDSLSGVKLTGFELTEGRKPVLKMQVNFTSLDKLNEAIAANKPASLLLGQFTITKENGQTKIERKLGTGSATSPIASNSYAIYATRYEGSIFSTHNGIYNAGDSTVRFRSSVENLAATQPVLEAVLVKPFPWGITIGALLVVGGLGWYGWQEFQKKKTKR